MPIAEIHLLAGRTEEQKRNLIREMTRAIAETVNVNPEQVRVIIQSGIQIHFIHFYGHGTVKYLTGEWESRFIHIYRAHYD